MVLVSPWLTSLPFLTSPEQTLISIIYILLTHLKPPRLQLPYFSFLSPFVLSPSSPSCSLSVMLTRGQQQSLSRSSLSKVWSSHAWIAELNRQLRPSWGPLDFKCLWPLASVVDRADACTICLCCHALITITKTVATREKQTERI